MRLKLTQHCKSITLQLKKKIFQSHCLLLIIWGEITFIEDYAFPYIVAFNSYNNPAAAKSLQSCPTLCDPMDCSLPGFSVHGILQARTLEWVAISFSSAWKWKVKVKSLSCLTLSDPMDCSLPGSSIHGIFQATVLEWGAIAFSQYLCNIL